MRILRRRLLQYTGVAGVLSMVPAALAQAALPLRKVLVRDAWALPRFDTGALLLADVSVTHFAGPGLYLYPDWGQPRPYLVSARDTVLEFRNPGTGHVLWTQTAGLATGFAGRVLEHRAAGALLADCPPLCVPALPATV